MSQLQPGKLLVLGFSGGPDSAAALHALHAAGWPLLAAHLDHGLRPESAQEVEAAARVAASYSGVEFVSQRVDVAALAAANGQTVEEAARVARYTFLFEVAHTHSAQAVVTAHTADDQAETIVMHLLRGAGPQGLHGMPVRWLPNPWSERVALVRPLLNASRQQVLAYCETHGLAVLHDPSNQDPAYFRNQVRHELLPLMEQYAAGFKGRLVQTGEILAAEEAVLQAAVEAAWRRSLAAAGAAYVGLQRSVLQAEPLALQRRVLQRAARTLRPGGELSFALVEQARETLNNEGGPYDWFEGLVLLAEAEHLWLAERSATLPAAWPQAPETARHIEVPAVAQLGPAWQLSLQPAHAAAAPLDKYETWLDAERSGGELTLRRPRSGDRVALAQGTQKLSDVFINAKLPQRARAAWPLLCKGDEVVWAPGLRLAHGFAARPGQAAVHAQVVRTA